MVSDAYRLSFFSAMLPSLSMILDVQLADGGHTFSVQDTC